MFISIYGNLYNLDNASMICKEINFAEKDPELRHIIVFYPLNAPYSEDSEEYIGETIFIGNREQQDKLFDAIITGMNVRDPIVELDEYISRH